MSQHPRLLFFQPSIDFEQRIIHSSFVHPFFPPLFSFYRRYVSLRSFSIFFSFLSPFSREYFSVIFSLSLSLARVIFRMGKRVDSNSIGQDADRSRVIFLLNRLQTLYLQKPRTDSGTGFFLLNGNSYHSMRLRMNRQYSAKFIFDVQVYVSAVWPEYRPGDHQRGRETGKFAKFRSRSNRLERPRRVSSGAFVASNRISLVTSMRSYQPMSIIIQEKKNSLSPINFS